MLRHRKGLEDREVTALRSMLLFRLRRLQLRLRLG